MNGCFLGIDTSNYTTSLAAVENGEILFNLKAPLPVKEGECGLRQSDALFSHTKNLPILFEKARPLLLGRTVLAIGVSEKPRNAEGSYMPCFLAGVSAASGAASVCGVPLYRFSHQCGHLRAALLSAGRDELVSSPFGAFHISGGTTEMLLVTPDTHGFHTEIVGGTRDLNAGQLVDRIGVALGLSFPAGPALESLASCYEGQIPKRPVKTENGYIHLSGVENQARKLLEAEGSPELTAAFVLDHLSRMIVAMSIDFRKNHALPLVYAGGVMSNAYIRAYIEKNVSDASFAAPALSADNAVGIAALCEEAHQKAS
ncbi:MAG: hypothetical protein E7609_00635 [Ruminococcaceae bacterium]|nr:hypothetical protein [Oscillospiraceae bacterium]